MRGTCELEKRPVSRSRFIPAHAGNIAHPPEERPLEPVHPRTCGEHTSPRIRTVSTSGSSPHMRGTLATACVSRSAFRFIPAHAGNIGTSASPSCVKPVHPRTCGEHEERKARTAFRDGSSPHMRGTFIRQILEFIGPRFIPAHAGNIRADRAEIRVAAVHPRTCGEHIIQRVFKVINHGSSPHMRGTYRRPGNQGRRRRFIPAHAGNINNSRQKSSQKAVHPRTCGEHRAS